MAEVCARKVVLKVEADPVGAPGTYDLTVGGLTTVNTSINNEPVDISNQSYGIHKTLSDCGQHSMSISGSGIYDPADGGMNKIKAAARRSGTDSSIINVVLEVDTGDVYTGPWLITSFNLGAEHTEVAKFDISLESAGEIVDT